MRFIQIKRPPGLLRSFGAGNKALSCRLRPSQRSREAAFNPHALCRQNAKGLGKWIIAGTEHETRSRSHRSPLASLRAQAERLQPSALLGFAALIAAASLVRVGGAHAIDGESIASAVAAAVPDSVSAAMAPVVQRTSAFIPGLIGDSPLREGIVSGFLLILFSELGDKTFFLALLLALKENKGLVFSGTFGALAVMTIISVALGQLLHQIDQFEFAGSNLPLDDYLAVALLTFFGVKTILDARNADESAAEEREEAEEEVSKFSSGAAGLLISTFTLVFAAEWGDKSFLATIALAAASSPTGVVIGAIAGHGLATGIAVTGGSYLGKYLDEKVVQYLGGSLFLVFAAATVVDIVRGV